MSCEPWANKKSATYTLRFAKYFVDESLRVHLLIARGSRPVALLVRFRAMIRRKIKGKSDFSHYIRVFLFWKASLPARTVYKSNFIVAGFITAVV